MRAHKDRWTVFGGRPGRKLLPLTLFAAVGLILSTASAAWGFGELSQMRGTANCVSETGGSRVFAGQRFVEPPKYQGICRTGRLLNAAEELAISPDGKNVYVATYGGNPSGAAIFDRNPATGKLTQKRGTAGCLTEEEYPEGHCGHARSFDEPQGVVVSPDGKQVYFANFDSDSVAIFDRGPGGALKQKRGTAGCISETGTDGHGGRCQKAPSIQSPIGIAASPDGKSIYVTAVAQLNNQNEEVDPTGRSISIFDRDPGTGNLTQKSGTAGCISGTGTGGGCQLAKGVSEPLQVVVSPDGKNVYVTNTGPAGLAIFDRDPATGALAQKPGIAGCISEDGTGGACQVGRALELGDVAMSADGKSLYVAASGSGAVSIFDRDPATGALTQKPGTAGCISQGGTGGACAKGKALARATAVAVTPDGKSVYVTATQSDAVSIFDRDPATGALTQKRGKAGCVAQFPKAGSCRYGEAIAGLWGVAISPDNKDVYVASIVSNSVSTFKRSLR